MLFTKQQPFGVLCWNIFYHLKAFFARLKSKQRDAEIQAKMDAKIQAENDSEIQAENDFEIQAKKKANIHNLYLSKHYAMYHKTWPF